MRKLRRRALVCAPQSLSRDRQRSEGIAFGAGLVATLALRALATGVALFLAEAVETDDFGAARGLRRLIVVGWGGRTATGAGEAGDRFFGSAGLSAGLSTAFSGGFSETLAGAACSPSASVISSNCRLNCADGR